MVLPQESKSMLMFKSQITPVKTDPGGVLFFSDVHLGSPLAPPQERIIELLDRHRRKIRSVFILGDLFDFWYGYKTVIFHRFLPLLFQLRQITDSGIAVHYIAGNHDFRLGPIFSDHLGVKTYDGAIETFIGGLRLYLAHGDLVDTKDRGYRLLHRLVRSRLMDWMIRMVPPDLGWKLAMAASHGSRGTSSKIPGQRRELFGRFADQLYKQGFDGVILGHAHDPHLLWREREGKKCLLANGGDWLRGGTYLLYRPTVGFSLHTAGNVAKEGDLPTPLGKG